MLNPKTPFAAGAIFLSGILVIAVTTLDIQRSMRANAIPVTLEQQHAVQELAKQSQEKSAGNVLAWVAGEPRRGSTRAEIRAAYRERIKQLHPDANLDRDTTRQATALIAAYQQLLQERALVNQSGDSWGEAGDEFDVTEGPVESIFVDPFACSVDPMQWRLLQEVARRGGDPADNLLAARVSCPPGAVHYLTASQCAAVEAELEVMEDTLAFDMTAYYLADCLLRARRTNDRLPTGRW